jgi:hypothetical protein
MGRACSMHVEEKCIYVFDGEAEGVGPLGRHTRTWEDDIKMDLGAKRWDGIY